MIKHCLIIIIINFFQIINAQQEQNFTIRPVNTNVVLGETAILKCAVTEIKVLVQTNFSAKTKT